jgi:molybdopterin-guanine dinucleotide biosynthesis protein A
MNIIVLTGGTSKRFGSDKSKALIGGKTLLELLTNGLKNLIIVGPKTDVEAKYVREVPEFGGPVAAIAAGMKEVEGDLVAIFATDMPFAPKLIAPLKSALTKEASLPVDCDGIVQPLAGIYRSAALRRALSEYEDLTGQSVKSLIAKLDVDIVPLVDTELLLDIDTPKDLVRAEALASKLSL